MRILKGTCDGREGRYNHCGGTNLFIVVKSRGQCKKCSDAYKNGKKPIRIPSAKKVQKAMDRLTEIQENQQYYLRAIVANQKRNGGKCLCDNCNAVIVHPTGSNVSHIISAGANKKLYHEPVNNFILCFTCEQKFSNDGKRSEMKIYKECESRKQLLNSKYYNK